MAGGIGKDVFPKTPVEMKDVLSAKGVRKAEMMQRILDAMNAYDIEERSFLELLFGKNWMYCSGWKWQEVGDEFMLEFVKVTRKKKRLRGQQQRRPAGTPADMPAPEPGTDRQPEQSWQHRQQRSRQSHQLEGQRQPPDRINRHRPSEPVATWHCGCGDCCPVPPRRPRRACG